MTVNAHSPYEYFYWVEEVSAPDRFVTTGFRVEHGDWSQGYTVSGNRAGPFLLDSGIDLGLMTVTNTYTGSNGGGSGRTRKITDTVDTTGEDEVIFLK